MQGKKISSGSASYAKGGSTKMFGYSCAGPQVAGTTSPPHKSDGKKKFAEGGTTKMFGKQTASKAGPC